jgi:hypothetical protein
MPDAVGLSLKSYYFQGYLMPIVQIREFLILSMPDTIILLPDLLSDADLRFRIQVAS